MNASMFVSVTTWPVGLVWQVFSLVYYCFFCQDKWQSFAFCMANLELYNRYNRVSFFHTTVGHKNTPFRYLTKFCFFAGWFLDGKSYELYNRYDRVSFFHTKRGHKNTPFRCFIIIAVLKHITRKKLNFMIYSSRILFLF